MSKEKPVEDNSQKVAEDSKQIAEKKPDLDFTALEPMVLMSASPGEFNEIDGTQDGDLLYGTTAKDLVEGLEGDDTILSGEGDDRIFGGAGKDTVLGGDGDDKIFGGDDNDYLAGQGGNNVIDAGAGDDTIQLGDGHDVVDGGEGIDLVELHNASGDVEVDMSDGSISGGLSAEISNVEAVVGSDHNDTYRFSDPSDGDVYFVYGLEGTNSLDLSQFSQGDLTMSAGTIQGPAGEGTFTIYYAEVAEIILADGTVAYEGEHIQWPEEYRGVLGGIGEEMGLFDEAPDSDGPLIGIEPPEGEESEPPVANNPDPTQNEDPTAVDDEYTFDEDTVLNGNVLTNDSDSDGDDLELFRIIQAPANGQIVANSDGSFEYTPNEHYFGSDFFTYEVVDRNGGSETATVRLNILPVNDAPEATNQTRTINEDSTLNGSVLQFASDIENDALEVTRLTQQPTVGTIEFDSNGDFRYVPDPDVNGVDSFTFEISDGNGGFTELTYTVNITPVADAPRAADDSFTIQEDTTAQGNVLTNDLEVDGEEITVSQITSRPENGHVTIDTNGNFIYTPKPNFHGVDRFEYEIVDETGLTSTAEVVLNVVSQNDGPDVINEQYDMAADEPLVANVLDNDSDVEGDTLSIQQVLTQPQNGSLDIDEDGRFTYIPDVGFEGTEVFQYVVSDGNGGTAVGTVTIEVEQAESVVIDDGEEEEEVESDNSDAIIKPSESLKNIIVGAIPVNEEGDPEGGVGTDVDVVDANETTIEELVSRMLGTGITVTDASLTSGANEQIGFITNMNTSMPGVTSFDEGLIISSGNVSSIGGPNTYDNTSGYMAHESYSYSKGQSTDANLGTVFDLSVLRIEFIPEGDKISGNYIFGSEEYIEYTNAGFNDNAAVILNGENISRTPDGQLLSIDTVNKDVNSHLFVDNDTGTSMGGVGNDAALNSPAPYYTEMDGFTKTLQFKHEVTPGEVNVLELKIGDVGDNAWDSWMIFEAESVRSNAIDMDLKELFEFPETSKEFSFTAQLTNGDPLPDYLSLNGDRLEGELPDDGTVDLNIEVTITDEDGNTSTVNFKIVSENLADNDVENVESDASVNDDSYTLDEGNILTISDPAEGLLANDRDADGDTLAVQTTPASQPANGSVTLNSNGTFTYTPNPDFHGTDSFEYTVVDSSGSEATATAEIVVGEIENDIGEVALTMYIEAGEDSTVGLTIPDRYEAEDVEYRISGLPAGATFTNGLDLGDGQWRVRGGELQGLRIVTADGVQTGEYQLIVESSFRSGSDLLTDELDAAEDDWKISDGVSNGSSAEDGVLGPFTGTGGEQGVFRTFEVGDRVQSVVIEFDFHEIDSWDGEDFMVFANDKLITADPFYNGEHSNGNAHYGDDHDRPYSVALGEEFTSGKSSWSDQVHRYRIVADVVDGQVKLGFGSSLNQGLGDESWAIDNLVISPNVTQYDLIDLTIQENKIESISDVAVLGQLSDGDALLSLDTNSKSNQTITGITVTGLPEGVTLSKGSVNSDGSVSLSSNDLNDIFVSGSPNEDFALRVRTDFTEVKTLYYEDFAEDAAGWNANTTQSNIEGAGSFLGRFNELHDGAAAEDAIIEKTFAMPSNVDEVILEFDQLELDAWEGEAFTLYINGEAISSEDLFNTLRINEHGEAELERPTEGSPEGEGAENASSRTHYVVRVSTGGQPLRIGFGSNLDQNVFDESWGIDNVRVSYIEQTNEMDSVLVQSGVEVEGPKNLIENGSFELFTNAKETSWGNATQSVAGWALESGTRFEPHKPRAGVSATDGDVWMDMGLSPGNLTISQQVDGVEDGVNYEITFDVANTVDSTNAMDVFWNGERVATISDQDSSWDAIKLNVVGGSGDGSNTLTFAGTGNEDNFGLSLDNVQMFEVENPGLISFASGSEQVTIDATNLDQNEGVRVFAQRVDANGDVVEPAELLVLSNGKIGVEGTPEAGVANQIGMNAGSGVAEQVVVEFDNKVVTGGEFKFTNLFKGEGDSKGGVGHEQGKWEAFKNGVVVASGTFVADDSNTGTVNIDLPEGVTADKLAFTPTEYSGGQNGTISDSSDFFITSISVDTSLNVGVVSVEPGIPANLGIELAPGVDAVSSTLTISALPDGAILNVGTDNGEGTWTVAAELASTVEVRTPNNFTGDLHIQVQVNTIDSNAPNLVLNNSFETAVEAIEVQNPGFEETDHGDGGWSGGTPGWDQIGSTGDWDPTSYHFPGLDAAEQVAWANTYSDSSVAGFGQDLSESFDPFKDYELTVDIGNRIENYDSQYEVRLIAGSTVVGSTTGSTSDIENGSFTSVRVNIDGDQFENLNGEPLRIEILNIGSETGGTGQVNFDNVRLMQMNDASTERFKQSADGVEKGWGVFDEVEGWQKTDGSGIEIQERVAGKASDGFAHVELDSHNNSGMYQDIPTEAGNVYQFEFDYSPRPRVAEESNVIEVYWNGEKIDTISADGTGNSNTDWQRFSYSLEAEGNESRIEFRASGTEDSRGGYIDDVSVKLVSTDMAMLELSAEPADEPNTLQLDFDLEVSVANEEYRDGIFIHDSQGKLAIFNSETLELTQIGTMGSVMTDVAVSPNGDLYGVTFDTLYSINPETAEVTEIGALGGFGMNSLTFTPDGQLYGGAYNSTNLFSIDVATGQAAPAGNIGEQSSGDLAFHEGELLMSTQSGKLISIDMQNGMAVGTDLVGNISSGTYGIASTGDNELYSSSGTTISQLNDDTAHETFVESVSDNGMSTIYGMASFNEVTPSPEATISGVPEGVMLSSGTQNPDGTWTVDTKDLEKLRITVPANMEGEELSVTLVHDGESATTSVEAQHNFIVNGSFENTGDTEIADGGWAVFQELAGWTLESGQQMEVVDDGHRGVEATDGDNWLDLDASPGNIQISQQVLGLDAGKVYTLSLDTIATPGREAETNGLDVFWNGEKVGTIGGEGGPISVTVRAGDADGTNTLTLGGTGDSNGYGLALDNIRLVENENLLVNASFENLLGMEDQGWGWNAKSIQGWTNDAVRQVDFNSEVITHGGYSQDRAGEFEVQEDGNTLSLPGNGWKSVPGEYEITADTWIEFEYRSTETPEFVSIGFDTDSTWRNGVDSNAENFFKIFGGQAHDDTAGNAYEIYEGNGQYQKIRIPIGQYMTGDFDRMTFINDDDSTANDGNSFFRNVRIYENDGDDFESHRPRGGVEASDGDYWMDMGGSPGNLKMSQQVPGVVDGEAYQLSFDLADSSHDSTDGLRVIWNGEVIAEIDGQDESMDRFEFAVTGGTGDGSNTLTFEGTGESNNFGVSLDNVELVSVDGPAMSSEQIVIDSSNLNSTEGVRMFAQRVDSDGNVVEPAELLVQSDGKIGVEGTPEAGVANQIGMNANNGVAEQVVIEFDNKIVTGGEFDFTNLFHNEGTNNGGVGHEQAKWEAFKDGVVVASGTFIADSSGNTGTVNIELPDGVTADKLAFTPTDYSGGQNGVTSDSSDFFLTRIEINAVSQAVTSDAYEREEIVDFGPGYATTSAQVWGSEGDDSITGTSRSEEFVTFDGYDVLDGGDGSDQLIVVGSFADYEVTQVSEGQYKLVDNGPNDSGTKIVSNFESFAFDDATLTLQDLLTMNGI